MPRYLFRVDRLGIAEVCRTCGLCTLFYMRGQGRQHGECDHAVVYTERIERVEYPVLVEDARAKRLPPFDRRPDIALEPVEGGRRDPGLSTSPPRFPSLEAPVPAALLAALEDGTDAVFAVDRERRFAFVNASAEALLRRGRAALLGTPAWGALPSPLGKRFEAAYRRATDHVAPGGFEAHFADGKRYLVRAYASPGGLVAFSCAVAATHALQHQVRLQAQLLDRVQLAVIATDVEGTILHWNTFATELYGWSPDEAVGRSIAIVSARHVDPAAVVETKARLRAGIAWSGEFLARRKDGTTFRAHVADAPIHDAGGALVGVAGMSRALGVGGDS